MGSFISQFDFSAFQLMNTVLLLFLFVFMLVRQLSYRLQSKQNEEIKTQLTALKDAQLQINRVVEEKMASHQQVVYTAISKDREKQLESISCLRVDLEKRFHESGLMMGNTINEFKSQLVEKFNHFIEKMTLSTTNAQSQLNETIGVNFRQSSQDLRNDLERSVKQQNAAINESISHLTSTTDKRLKEISGEVDKRLAEGFDKTTQTFGDVLKRLALIDDAQKKITALSNNVMSLQEILNDKRSRGAFGEIQLQSLISNIMPKSHYALQHKFSNDKIVDCTLLLPEPTGKIAIDAKFPLESFKKMMDLDLAEGDRLSASKQFVKDIKKHINDIADKYILPPETSDGAVMFIPAESVFAEIHSHYPELVEYSYKKKVWLVSPTTLMAVLTTAAAVIKDEQTRKQVHIIKEHLIALSQDFMRFQNRMDSLSKHIGQVTKDVEQVNVSAKKISSRFGKIERVEINEDSTVKSLDMTKIIAEESS